jgi:uncharacterized membrane protein YdbT with pleckstrin-like domain
MNSHYLQSLLGSHEVIHLVTRQHWFVLARAILLEVVVSLAIILLVVLPPIFIPTIPAVIYFGLLALLIPFGSLSKDVMTYFNHEYIITNRRVIQIDGVVNKNVIDSSLEKVNDVRMDQSFFGRIFNFGDVEILTASEQGINKFMMIGDPVGFKVAMLNSKVALEQEIAGSGHAVQGKAQSSKTDIPALIAQLDALRKQGALTEAEFQAKKAELLSKL